jgi:hypothetical protein
MLEAPEGIGEFRVDEQCFHERLLLIDLIRLPVFQIPGFPRISRKANKSSLEVCVPNGTTSAL